MKTKSKKITITILIAVGLPLLITIFLPTYIIAHKPDQHLSNLYSDIGMYKYLQGNIEESKKYLELSLKHDPHSEEALNLKNILHLK